MGELNIQICPNCKSYNTVWMIPNSPFEGTISLVRRWCVSCNTGYNCAEQYYKFLEQEKERLELVTHRE